MSNINTGTTSDLIQNLTNTSLNYWNEMILQEVKEVGESIEVIYTQQLCYTMLGGFPPYSDKRAVKIIYSCIDGKWNKSNPIYGKIIPAKDEYYEFED